MSKSEVDVIFGGIVKGLGYLVRLNYFLLPAVSRLSKRESVSKLTQTTLAMVRNPSTTTTCSTSTSSARTCCCTWTSRRVTWFPDRSSRTLERRGPSSTFLERGRRGRGTRCVCTICGSRLTPPKTDACRCCWACRVRWSIARRNMFWLMEREDKLGRRATTGRSVSYLTHRTTLDDARTTDFSPCLSFLGLILHKLLFFRLPYSQVQDLARASVLLCPPVLRLTPVGFWSHLSAGGRDLRVHWLRVDLAAV